MIMRSQQPASPLAACCPPPGPGCWQSQTRRTVRARTPGAERAVSPTCNTMKCKNLCQLERLVTTDRTSPPSPGHAQLYHIVLRNSGHSCNQIKRFLATVTSGIY
eukprot:1065694-Pelagomonas_calceolata.AAC.2